MAVVVHHIGVPDTAPSWLRMIVQCGFIGVPLFFMLSGFVLAHNYPDLDPRRPRALVRFWVARIARVMPLYWAVLLWAVVVREVRGTPQDPSLWMQVLGVQTWSGDLRVGSQIYNGPAWSVCVELFLYAIFPVLVVAVVEIARRWGARGLVLLVVLAVVVQVGVWAAFVLTGRADLPPVDPASAHRWLYRNPLTRIPEFLVGMTLAVLFARGHRLPPALAGAAQTAVTVAVPVVCALRDPANTALGAAFFGTLWTVPFALLVLSLASDRGPVARVLATRTFVTLGVASYALYITHRGLLPGFGHDLVTSAPGRWGYVMVLVVLALTLVVAEGAHRYVEVPARRMILTVLDLVLPPDGPRGLRGRGRPGRRETDDDERVPATPVAG